MARKRKPQYSTFVNPGAAQAGAGASFGDENQINLSASVGPSGVRVAPTVRFGDSKDAQTGGKVGATVGGAAGSAVAGPVGGAIGTAAGSAYGSALGGSYGGGNHTAGANIGTVALGPGLGTIAGSAIGGLIGGGSKGAEETDQRKGVINAYKDGGLFDKDGNLALPDGSVFNALQDSKDGQHDFKYQDRRVDNQGDRKLFNYDIDYTNDLDYISGMAGVSLSRVLSGGTNKQIDQVGGMLGNAFLGKSGHGAEFNQQTFENTITNARATYAKKGIDSKEEFMALANKMFSEGRIKDSDYAVMNQTASMVFDKDFNTASQLMAGRNSGVQVAGKSAANSGATMVGSRPGRVYSPVISPEEAMLSVSPYLAQYKAAKGKDPKGASNTASDLTQAAGVITAVAGIYGAVNKASGGKISDYIRSGVGSIRDSIMGTNKEPSEGTSVGGGTDLGSSLDSGSGDSAPAISDGGISDLYDSVTSGF